MPGKLKTYVTQIGFFELAVAAPSMKAALEAWGASRNLFHQGFARETDDPGIIAAAATHPGMVLKRAVGTRGAFRQDAALPKTLPAGAPKQPNVKARPAKAPPRKAPAKAPTKAKARAAILSFEKAKARRDRAHEKEEARRSKQEAAQARQDQRRERAAAKLESLRDTARARHAQSLERLEQACRAAEEKLEAERARWKKEEEKLDEKIRKARR